MGLSVEDMDQMTMGMVIDMQTEAVNDQAEYPYKATSADLRNFIGGGHGRQS